MQIGDRSLRLDSEMKLATDSGDKRGRRVRQENEMEGNKFRDGRIKAALIGVRQQEMPVPAGPIDSFKVTRGPRDGRHKAQIDEDHEDEE
jgi:hypothetical protein